MDLYGVIGNPVAHSRSPEIHMQFAGQTGQHISYEKILAELNAFETTVDSFRGKGGKGLNVTLPFKQEAHDLADELSPRARMAGAVNTLSFGAGGRVLGDNTDGAGLVHDLRQNLGVSIEGSDVLILGAGGAVRGTLGPMLAEHPANIVIANRTLEKAILLADHFSTWGKLCGCDYTELGTQSFDIIINGTSMGLSGDMPPLPDDILRPGGACYDMAYGKEPTVFQRWGQAHNAKVAADGLGMLVEQAAESFLVWRGVRPDTASLLKSLR